MTEDEAKKKWCPMKEPLLHVKTLEISYEKSCCIASDCMIGCDKEGNWLGYCGLTSK